MRKKAQQMAVSFLRETVAGWGILASSIVLSTLLSAGLLLAGVPKESSHLIGIGTAVVLLLTGHIIWAKMSSNREGSNR